MKIRPLYDRIVVKRIEEKETMQGGLYIPDSAKEKPQEGEVVAVGKGKRLEDGKVVPLDVEVGNRIQMCIRDRFLSVCICVYLWFPSFSRRSYTAASSRCLHVRKRGNARRSGTRPQAWPVFRRADRSARLRA